MTEKQYKYVRKDFRPLPVRLRHMELYINFLDSFVEVTNILDISALVDLDKIELDARDLEVLHVSWEQFPARNILCDVKYSYLEDKNKLMIFPDYIVRAGEVFKVRTVTRLVPSDNVLEGIYKDFTPPGAPQQYMSQCQQWGFQRIAPVFDDCRAKCRMLTTIEADARYTNLISNGVIDPHKNPDGVPTLKPDDPSRKIITYINDIPMAPYLFIVCVGTWDTLMDYVRYKSGKKVRLEYLTPLGRSSGAIIPMQILKEAILWVGETQNYEYKSDVYRTICMSKSNFGGMENVGNTTIVTDAALVDEHTTDMSLLYAHSVIVHEFEHNQCGSETTMETPFDVWLNEAYTVDVERNFLKHIFDPTFIRLNQIDSIRNPLLGPLAIEDNGKTGIIVRQGFNDPDELIDSVTYVKAAEVIRMLRLLLGWDTFNEGKQLYFSRYKDSNANTDQFFECFEETSGKNLEQFKKCWLYRIGYPKVSFKTFYDSQAMTYKIQFCQKQSNALEAPFHIPIELAAIDNTGNVINGTNLVFEFKSTNSELVFKNIPTEPAFVSVNRNYSFYGTCLRENENQDSLILQIRLDDNLFNRIEAFRRLTDIQRIRLLKWTDAKIDDSWIELFGELLCDRNVAPSTKAFFIRIDEQPLDRNYSSWILELVDVHEKLIRTINNTYKSELIEEFESLDTYKKKSSPKDDIEERILKQTLLELIVIDDTPDSHDLIRSHYARSTSATDKIGALVAMNRSSMIERTRVLEKIYRDWVVHISAYSNYLKIISSGWNNDVFEMIKNERERPSFDITNPTWARALFLTMAGNTKKIWTKEGIIWATQVIIDLASLNTYVASKLLNVFQDYKRMRPNLKSMTGDALKAIIEEIPEKINPTINRQALSYFE